MNLDLPAGFCYLDYNATVRARVIFLRVALIAACGDVLSCCARPIILQAPMSESVRQFLIASLQNGFFGNPSTPNAVGQVNPPPPPPLRDDHNNHVAHSKRRLLSTQLAAKSLIFLDATPMKSFSRAVEVRAPTMPFEAYVHCKSSSEPCSLCLPDFFAATPNATLLQQRLSTM